MKKKLFDILNTDGFYDTKHTKRLNSAQMKDGLFILPKGIPETLNPPLAAIGNEEYFYEEKFDNDLEGHGIEKFHLTIQHICYLH